MTRGLASDHLLPGFHIYKFRRHHWSKGVSSRYEVQLYQTAALSAINMLVLYHFRVVFISSVLCCRLGSEILNFTNIERSSAESGYGG